MINSPDTVFMCVYFMHAYDKKRKEFSFIYVHVKCRSQQNMGHKSYDVDIKRKMKT